ncbi:hypothetical protein BH23BAC1_BH23BAC1_22850 [soil metagenome]
MIRLALSLLCWFVTFNALAQQRVAAFEMNARLGRGINMGNAFEAPTETAWGNPWQPEYFQIMKELGFQHVRLPIRWETEERGLPNAPFTINATFLARIKEVVDQALEQELIIIINMHHHDLLLEDPLGQKERFLSQWQQIADFFKEYPLELIFEVMNEPHDNLTPDLWNQFFAEALAEIRKTNPDRIVLMGTAEYGGLSGVPLLQLPQDENIIVTVHYYNPFNFTHQGAEWVGPHADAWLGTEWQDTEAERETIIREFNATLAFSEENNIPIHVGELGAYSKADLASRVRWTTFLTRWLEEQNLSWAYWEFSAGFGIYDPNTGEILEPLANALLHNEIPDPVATEATVIYTSNFSGGADGWNLYVQGGAAATLNATSGTLLVSGTNGGTESWHIQLSKNNVPLQQGRMYRISFNASSSPARNVTAYAGKASDPWTSYSGYSSFSLVEQNTSYSFVFNMSNPTDLQARIVFDVGKTMGNIEITEVKLEEINMVVTALWPDQNIRFRFYPNPVYSHLHLSGDKSFRQALLYDLKGRKLEEFVLSEAEISINLEKYSPGIYMIRLLGNKGNYRILKIQKK